MRKRKQEKKQKKKSGKPESFEAKPPEPWFWDAPLPYNGREDKHILIGKSLLEQRPVYYEMQPWGVTIVAARSRSGKSAIVKNIAYQISRYVNRPLLVFDFFDEWIHTGEYNFDAPVPAKMDNLHVVENFAFRISQFNDFLHWAVLGFSPKAAETVLVISQRADVHHDDIALFKEILMDLPETPSGLEQFNRKYPDLGLNYPLHKESKRSVIEAASMISDDFFWSRKNGKICIDDFGQLWKENPNLCIRFGLQMGSENDRKKALMYCSLILEQISSNIVERMMPVIICEEASYIIPDETLEPISLSRTKLLEYAEKFLRYKVCIFAIFQSSRQVSKRIIDAAHQRILGPLGEGDMAAHGYWDRLRRLKFRQFLYVNGNDYVIFNSDDCPVKC